MAAGKYSLLPLKHAAFKNVAVGRFISFLGNGIAPVALAFAVLDLTGSAAQLGLLVAVRALASTVVMLYGGVLADRMPRALLMQGSALAAGGVQAAAGISVVCGFCSMPLLTTLAALSGALSALAMPSSMAVVAQTVPKDLLPQANALLRLSTKLALVIGSSVGGLLVAACGSGWGLIVDAATYVLAAYLFSRVKASGPVKLPKRGTLVSDLREGWSEFVSHTWLWIVVLQATIWQAVWAGAIQVIGPLIAVNHIGEAAWGFVLASYAAGTIVGGLVALRWRPERGVATGVAMTAVSGVLPLTLAFSSHPPVLIAAGFLAGLSMEQVMVASSTAVQSTIPPARLARVASFQIIGSSAAVPLGQALAGPLANSVGTRNLLIGGGLIIVLAATCSVSSRSVRDVRTTQRRQAVPATVNDKPATERTP
ncbi:MFS transporter [Streptomyces sp. NBC_00464]|uniref:MFS transporter n=1 Tax=Streptomyces sp. NBC_00464 TaxID=2975751 RepID=UPI002E195581